MGNFNRGGRSGGGRSFGGRRDFNRGSDRPTLHKTICSKCGKECEVPFRPTGSKPVFCRDCFRDNGGTSDSRRPEGNFSRPSFDSSSENRGRGSDGPQYKEQFEALNAKLDKILRILTPDAVKEEAPMAQEEVLQEVDLQPEEQAVPEKKKRAPKKTAIVPEEQA